MLRGLEDLQLEVDVCRRRLRLTTIPHIYPILLHIIGYSFLLARTIHVDVIILQAEPLGDPSGITRTT
jgi:hypothetical protein